jgi:uncharacterized protein (TIRG00374 family)
VSNSAENKSANSNKYFSRKYLFISIALSLAGMGGVIYMTYTPGVLKHLIPKRLPGLFIALIVSFLRLWFVAAKIKFLSEEKLGWLQSFRVVLAWDFTSAVTPSTVGGAPLATFAMSKEGLSLGRSTAIILYSLLLDQLWFALSIPVLLICSIYFAVIPPDIGLIGHTAMFIVYAAILAYAGVLAYGVLKNPTALKKVVNGIFSLPFLNRWKDKMAKEAEHLEEYSYELRKKPYTFVLKAFLLSTLSWICRIALPTIVILSLLPANVVLSLLRSLAMNLAFLFMPTPGGSGGVEGLFALFQGPVIDRKAFIGLAVFLWRIISYYISIGLGMMAATWYINRSVVDNFSRGSDQQEQEKENAPSKIS